ncbi:MAG TPA: pyridoxal phosphate-dependent aminotransferase [Acidimicrobiales bacterium]|nr:pyridoxal phosphate-dependent aminotransferase [Acidimicrobiales bacterium]
MATSPGTRISARIAAIEESATLAVDAKYKAMQAAGEDVIGFAAGEPDFPTPAHIVEAAVEACKDPKNHKYSPAGGLPELKEAIAAKTARDSGYTVAASQVLVTNGGKHALYDAFATLLDPGDEALLPSPYWTTYPESIKLAGGVPVIVPTDISTGFKATVEQLDAACTERTKLLVFVSPSNPSGAVYSPAEIKAIGEWAVSRGIWVVTDEIYEHLTYDQAVFASMPVLVPDLADRCVIVNGVAKTYAMTGWRVGWVIGPQDVITASFNLQSHATSNVSNVAQRAALAAVSGGLEDVAKFREAFNRRRLTMYEMLSAIDGVEVLLPEGAFYAYPSFESFVGTKVAGRQVSSTLELSTVILEEAKVAFVPGEAFGTPGYARFSFAMADEPMAEGIRRIAKALS